MANCTVTASNVAPDRVKWQTVWSLQVMWLQIGSNGKLYGHCK